MTAIAAGTVSSATLAQSNAAANVTPQDIVVTAQKRTERLLDVPVPVSTVTAESLRTEDKLRLQDYYNQVPGVSFTSDPVNGPADISIRGLSTGLNTNPTVAFTIDDVPYGSSRADGGSILLPEIDPGDLERLEVLRGPQGTLYGANSLGGLIKFVTVQPSLNKLTGQISAGLSGIRNGDNPGYRLYGSINLPISDTLALRASGFTRDTPGYIEDPLRHVNNIGRSRASGGRLATLWQPVSDFTLKLSGFYQVITQNGSLRETNPDSPYLAERGLTGQLGYLQQDDTPGTGRSRTQNLGFNLTTDAKLGVGQLTTITGFTRTRYRVNPDDTRDFLTPPYPGAVAISNTADLFGDAVPDNTTNHTFYQSQVLNKFSQEVRLATPLTHWLDSLIGAFYTHESYSGSNISYFVRRDNGEPIATRDDGRAKFRFSEVAAFANLTVRFSDRFDVQGGFRWSRNDGTFSSTDLGPAINGAYLFPPSIGGTFRSKEDVSTFLLTPRYKINPDNMIYGRFSTGYRPGGYNNLDNNGQITPPYRDDTTKNYELGYKGSLLDRKLTIDASIYRIDWNNIQLLVLPPAAENYVTVNAGAARSEGVELSVDIRPWKGLSVSGWVDFARAKLTKDFPATAIAQGFKGDRLPDSTKFSSNLSITQEFPLSGRLTGYVGSTYTHVGNRLGGFAVPFGNPPFREHLPSYNTVDLRAGIKHDPWSVDLYMTNAGNSHGIIFADQDYVVPIKPREIGINASYRF